MGPVEDAIRATFTVPVTLHTVGQAKPFVLSEIDRDGIVLLLGQGEWYTRLTWECLESVVPFLRGQAGWVPAGGVHSVAGEPGTFDEHLKGCLKRDVARWLAVVLRDAGVVQLSEGPPLKLRLTERFGRVGSASGAQLGRDWDAAPGVQGPSAPSQAAPSGAGFDHDEGAVVRWRRSRSSAAIIAVTVEVAAFIAWRLILRRRRGR